MYYSNIKGFEKKCSRFILGTMEFNNPEKTADYFEMLDFAFENGINTIDTAAGYGRGVSETVIGQWMAERGNRDEILLTTKCCHHLPYRHRVNVYDMGSDLLNSLAKMKLDYIDVLYLHRDDVNTPVSDIIDAINVHYQAGRFKAAAAANWSYERIKAANEYAEANGLIGFSMAEEHYSIAEQIADPFGWGSGTISGPKYAEARAYYVEKNLPIASYSTLSGGFITGRITRELLEKDPDSINPGTRVAYCHEVNFKRLDRAAELAKQKGVTIAQIGLAYAMCGEMDVYPIIGARNKEEVISSLEALEIKLTKEECDWVDCTID